MPPLPCLPKLVAYWCFMLDRPDLVPLLPLLCLFNVDATLLTETGQCHWLVAEWWLVVDLYSIDSIRLVLAPFRMSRLNAAVLASTGNMLLQISGWCMPYRLTYVFTTRQYPLPPNLHSWCQCFSDCRYWPNAGYDLLPKLASTPQSLIEESYIITSPLFYIKSLLNNPRQHSIDADAHILTGSHGR